MSKGSEKKRKLDMSKNSIIRHLLLEAVKNLPENIRGSIVGTVYSKGSKIDIFAARDYVVELKNKGIIDEETAKNIIDIIFKYSKYY
ncbi:MAG: hypothetical protein ACP5JT_00450 [Thermoplasmata archaeon]|jgi:hypothetical protein